MSENHDWRLVAPWYRWPRQRAELGRTPRATRPVFQKYEDSKLVELFLADPQHSLKFTDDDRVQETAVLLARTIATGPLKTKHADASVKRGDKPGRYERYVPTATSIRKLFLDAHSRFYLVVCELHCDVPGFPRAGTGEVCQAGFVVRRRYTTYPDAAEPEAAEILKRIARLQLSLAKLERRPAAERALRRWEVFPPPNANGAVKAKRDELRLALRGARKELRHWAAVSGAREAQAGWVTSERRDYGDWQVVDDEPETLLEHVYPLYPLKPGPGGPEHAGRGTTIYFGLVPTSSSDHDPLGRSRYDDRHLYEIRCFTRRHKACCPQTAAPNDCNGDLFWSEPTEPFQLAAPFDPVGTSHRPINVVLPDLPALAAQAAARPVGALSPVRVTQPPRSSLHYSSGPPPSGHVGDGQVCFLAIPLVTIVAWFLLNMILPMLTMIFGLWFLLRLKFCIPPSLAVSEDIDKQLAAADQGGLDLEVDAGVDVELPGEANPVTFDAAWLNTELANTLANAVGGGATAAGDLSQYSNKPLIELQQGITKPHKGPDFSAGIEWEERVERAEVLIP